MEGLRELNICETENCEIKVCELDLEKSKNCEKIHGLYFTLAQNHMIKTYFQNALIKVNLTKL